MPIILDDALVYSDDERIERMFDALGRAAGQQQVVVFTCRTRAFQRLGGRRLTLEVDRRLDPSETLPRADVVGRRAEPWAGGAQEESCLTSSPAKPRIFRPA